MNVAAFPLTSLSIGLIVVFEPGPLPPSTQLLEFSADVLALSNPGTERGDGLDHRVDASMPTWRAPVIKRHTLHTKAIAQAGRTNPRDDSRRNSDEVADYFTPQSFSTVPFVLPGAKLTERLAFR